MTLGPSALRIMSAATAHFAEHGYSGSSLTRIAEAAGMRKASLYAHFRSKDELFLVCFHGAINEEQQCAVALLDEGIGRGTPGERYCRSFVRRYSTSRPLQFMLRTAYMPPLALTPQVDAAFERYLTLLADGFIAAIRQMSPGRELPVEEAALREIYISLVDSVQVKLVYTNPELAMYRLETLRALLAPLLSGDIDTGGV